MIKTKYITWNYVKDILTGNKKLLKVSEIHLNEIPPKHFK